MKLMYKNNIVLACHVCTVAIFFILTSLLSACSTTKFVPGGSHLLNKVDVEVDGRYPDINRGQMKSYLRQHGNSRWFSTLKIPLATYSLSGRDTTKWINRTLRSIGEAPVLYDSVHAAMSCTDLRQELQNEGYLSASVDVKTETRGKKINVCYNLHPGQPYYIGKVQYVIADQEIKRLLEEKKVLSRSIKSGSKFNVQELDNERKRITGVLVSNGYYKFNKEFISFVADTVSGRKEVDVTLLLHKFRTNSVKDSVHPRFIVRNVMFHSNDASDSVIKLRRNVLEANNFISKGKYYSSLDLRKTYSHFGRLQAVKYTNVSFTELRDTGVSLGNARSAPHMLDCNIYINTNKPGSISFQPEGTNTAGDFGAAASLTYQNRNLFHGSELLSIEFRGAYEAIKGLEGYANDNFEEFSVETSLMFPRFIAPFIPRGFKRRNLATSEVAVMYDLQNRPEYHRRVLSLAWRYKWNDSNHHDKYQVDLLAINYVSMPWISDKFRKDYLEDETNYNAILRYNYEDLLIMKTGFGFSYNNGRYAVKTNMETAGNLLGLAARMFNAPKNSLGQRETFFVAFAQYVKGDIDFTRNFVFDYNNSLVFHFAFGIAWPYGNSNILPFEKRYFSGGANSVRGWSVRSLGPGKFRGTDGNIDFINQTGDLKLDINLEYRAHLFWKFNGALFIDAGNIWTLRDYPDQPGGSFKFSSFYNQIAVAYGLGIRLNFDFFILRFDMGMKAINPAYVEKKEHYAIVHPDLGRDFAFHFAVGLPF